jgi:hypothetical protein
VIDEILGGLADLNRIASDDLHREFVEHLIEDLNASLAVKFPSFIHGAPADELSAKFGNAVLAVFNFGGELTQLQQARFRVVGKSIAAMLGKVCLPCGD